MEITQAWISGASSGLGAALVATAPDAVTGIRDLSRSGGTSGTTHVPVDLATPDGWDRAQTDFADVIGSLADTTDDPTVLLIHNAGTITPIGPAGSTDLAAYRTAVLLDAAAPPILGTGFLAAAADAGLPAQIVMITSGAATSVYEGWSHYCAAKAAVDHWVRTVGAEQQRRGADGARVLAVSPGVVDTPMQAEIRRMDAEQFPRVDKFRQLHADGALVSPEQAARGVWSVLGDASLPTGSVTDLRNR
ncbi:SDR family oxidoreductase [Euzebya tangerina]|uniref:SDR family oxidoreductase n=1 Tax=Euzebya tangerina TaxID=591198 RepID=UPI0013C2C1E2|nr:SDR family oxidoreductase [Euzebya tangerina]